MTIQQMERLVTTAAVCVDSCRVCNLPLDAPSLLGCWEPAEDGWSDLVMCHDMNGSNARRGEVLAFEPVDV